MSVATARPGLQMWRNVQRQLEEQRQKFLNLLYLYPILPYPNLSYPTLHNSTPVGVGGGRHFVFAGQCFVVPDRLAITHFNPCNPDTLSILQSIIKKKYVGAEVVDVLGTQ